MFNINEICDCNFLYKKDDKFFYYVSEFEKLKQLTLINIYESDEYKRLLCMDLPYFEFTMDYKNSIYEKLYLNRIDWYYEIKENHLYPLSIYVDLEFFNYNYSMRLYYSSLFEKIGTKVIINSMKYYNKKNKYIIMTDKKFSEIIFQISLHINKNIYFGSKMTTSNFMHFSNHFNVLLCNSENIELLGNYKNIKKVLYKYNKSSFKNEIKDYNLKLYLVNYEDICKLVELAKLGYRFTDITLYSDVSIKEEELVILSCMFKTAYSKIN